MAALEDHSEEQSAATLTYIMSKTCVKYLLSLLNQAGLFLLDTTTTDAGFKDLRLHRQALTPAQSYKA